MNNTPESIDDMTWFADMTKITKEEELEVLFMDLHCLSSQKKAIEESINNISAKIWEILLSKYKKLIWKKK